ncbi:cell wall hydrolase [Magnetospirillum sp. UT-4]|uniref:cell wall hydrolase n=1 Tax=Magnetospirillum sp. UT-4 TaxID=2681467 RepID=UPI00138401D8|nr:cell wall hydrolase [Magnetospirillum sp. UT-4]CAA7612174.1 exported hypothetical protein [Magnetospirillum sp. UT-4]
MDGRTLPFAAAAFALGFGMAEPATAPHPAAGATPPGPPPAPVRKASAAELHCLALNVYWEARGEPDDGLVAVAHVTLNRADDPAFPGSICAVVHQRAGGGCQFGWVCTQPSHQPDDQYGWSRAQTAARRALAGNPDPTDGALYFHGIRERPQWAQGRYRQRMVIGGHVFFSVKG